MSSDMIATYQSSTDSKTISQSITANDKSRHLADLRLKVKEMQTEINQFLTAKMEQDKAPKDEQDETDYGEEKVD